MEKTKEYFMKKALNEAKKAAAMGEVPVGAVIVRDGKVISYGKNKREINKNATAHAEMEAIQKACKKLGGWRLFECDMYVTLEPCPMCAGAIINSRIKNLYIGAYDKKGGAVFSVAKLFELPFNHKPQVEIGILAEECSDILKVFFKGLR
jgi:tRNA(adenine34) deaminase